MYRLVKYPAGGARKRTTYAVVTELGYRVSINGRFSFYGLNGLLCALKLQGKVATRQSQYVTAGTGYLVLTMFNTVDELLNDCPELYI